MTAKRALGLVMVSIAFLLAPATGFAQDNTTESAPTPAPVAPAEGGTTATITDGPSDAAPETTPALPWLKFCGDLPDGQQLCLVRQLVFAQNQPIARLILRNNPAEKNPLLLMASMPLGVTLPYGLRLQIDSGRELALPLHRL